MREKGLRESEARGSGQGEARGEDIKRGEEGLGEGRRG